MTDWNNDMILRFLELYESERIIWDPSAKNHKLKHKVRDAWKRISLNMGNIPIDELKSKKKSLMATFRPLLKKKKASITSGVDAEDVFQPVWFAYEIMERFLGPVYDLDLEETINTEDELQQSETMMPPQLIQPLHNDEIPPPSSTVKNTYKAYPNKKRSNIYLDETQKNIHESFEILNKKLKRKKEEEDECDIYGKLLAKKLRKYPERMRDHIMYKIDGLLLENPYPDESPPSSCSYYASQSTPSENSSPHDLDTRALQSSCFIIP